MEIKIPELSLVVLIGVSSSGKSTFARQHFLETEIISSDQCRATVSDNESDMDATGDAFDLVHFICAKRLKRGKLTLIDATNVQLESRKPLIALAREHHCLPVAIVLDIPDNIIRERHAARPDRNFGQHVLNNQRKDLKKSLRYLKKEGFRQVHVIKHPSELEAIKVSRVPLWNNKKHLNGPFDIIGDAHGCFDELQELLIGMGYEIKTNPDDPYHPYLVTPPEGRKAIFLGDLVDRGPRSPEVLKLVMSMVKNGLALCIPGNHDVKLLKKLRGKQVAIRHGLAETLEQLSTQSPEFIEVLKEFLDSLISHYVLDDGKLVVAHAGLREEMQGRASSQIRSFCLYGETTGEIDEFGLPVRYDWAREYKGKALVVYGHTPIPKPDWLNNTINIDTGCVFGGAITALRYPEKELVRVEAKKIYAEPARPIAPAISPQTSAQPYEDFIPDIQDVLGKKYIQTRFGKNITIREENTIAALETMSRFAIDPQSLIYLPPTMSPPEVSQRATYLEHPDEALAYYASEGIEEVICEEKHMGSRAVFLLFRDPSIAQDRFNWAHPSWGIIHSRTGRRFFSDESFEQAMLSRIARALHQDHFWARYDTNWVCLDAEILPWSAKAQSLIQQQYAAVYAAARSSLEDQQQILSLGLSRYPALQELLDQQNENKTLIEQYARSYRNYCRDVKEMDDWKVAPFHILATDAQVHLTQTHLWHMEEIASFCQNDPQLLKMTEHHFIQLKDPLQRKKVVDWWEELTNQGGEGMVVKPKHFYSRGEKGIVQPGIKCRGREYLRIIYGPDYTKPQQMEKLKNRSLTKKRSLAIREFALGLEALERFVQKESLSRVHECVFAVLALESEAVDPRL